MSLLSRAVVFSFALVLLFESGVTRSTFAQDSSNEPPAVGEQAPALLLSTVEGDRVSLEGILEERTAVVIFLRGFPGYQCPLCSRQVREFIAKGEEFEQAGARLVLIYPGPGPEMMLKRKAAEFLEGVELPTSVQLVLDPNYEVVSRWNLRWAEEGETAYPSTFVVGQDGKIRFSKISRTHGDRSSVADVLEALKD